MFIFSIYFINIINFKLKYLNIIRINRYIILKTCFISIVKIVLKTEIYNIH